MRKSNLPTYNLNAYFTITLDVGIFGELRQWNDFELVNNLSPKTKLKKYFEVVDLFPDALPTDLSPFINIKCDKSVK